MSPIHASPSPAAAPHAATAPSAPTDALLATLDAWTDAPITEVVDPMMASVIAIHGP
jgi:hypothetical protein